MKSRKGSKTEFKKKTVDIASTYIQAMDFIFLFKLAEVVVKYLQSQSHYILYTYRDIYANVFFAKNIFCKITDLTQFS